MQRKRRPSKPRSPPVKRPPREDADFLIVGVGTSAGGLDACRKLLRALPDSAGMAFVLVQHLDPNHESLMVDLLAGYTSMTVRQAANGMPIEREHLYVIPPGTYLSVGGGLLHLSPPPVRHGARLPFDHLLHSLAADYGARAACVVLSGTGTDGSLGLRAVKEKHGLVIVQDPEEAAYDGMPRSAIMTGLVDRVVPVAQIPQALAEFAAHMTPGQEPATPASEDQAPDGLAAVIELLRTRTDHDFTLYKPGTLSRRIERRMGMASIRTNNMAQYAALFAAILRSSTCSPRIC